MVTQQDIIDLKQAYTLWQSLDVVFEYGPLRSYAEQAAVQQLWNEIIAPAVKVVEENSRKTGPGAHVTEAPSPWHAYFYLRAQQQYVYRSGRPFGSPVPDQKQQAGEHLFFRGQRCASWELISSLRRKDSSTQEVEQRAAAALTEYFRNHFVADDDIARNTARCFAQHYGIATDLTDISCDSDIAVWFATHPVGETCPSSEREAIVQSVSWAGQAGAAETLFLLPPPFVRNVYEQRGLFIDTSSTNGRLKGNLSLEVRFPRETAGGEFQVLRRGRLIEVWPGPDAAERQLISWARTVGAACPNAEAVRDMVKSQEFTSESPTFWIERALDDPDKHIIAWLSILDWVLPATCVTALPVDGPEPMRYEILDSKVQALVRANRTFFKAFVGAVEDSNLDDVPVLKQVLLLASDELGR